MAEIALIPVNVKIGDLAGNLRLHQDLIQKAASQGAGLLVFPELSLVGYYPRDLMNRPSWAARCEAQLAELHEWLQKKFPKLAVVVGTSLPTELPGGVTRRNLANCAVFLEGARREVRAKTLIPFYDVFHENRHFDSAANLPSALRAAIDWQGRKLGLLICEDSWDQMELLGKRLYSVDPTKHLMDQGCDLLVNLSASPYDRHKKTRRREAIRRGSADKKTTIAYVNHYGAQDEILFDGDAFVFAEGELLAEKTEPSAAPLYWGKKSSLPKTTKDHKATELRDLAEMLVLGIRDYCAKNGATKAVLGLSGGMDSALVAVLAAEALGPANVIGLAMPSKFSSVHSVEDAEELARACGIRLHHLPIKMPHSTFGMALRPFFEGMPEDTTEENLQARLRGTAVMAFANKFRALALATGNKSEFAMGYSTLYGDMCGALAPIGDLYKTEVYELARYINRLPVRIPERTFTKPPSAELRPNQTDQDSLPPYDLLDACLKLLIESELDPAEALPILRKDFPKVDQALVDRVHRTLVATEYKRKQAPPILRVSSRAFGSGRVYPLTCLF